MEIIQMQILLPHLIAIPDNEYEVYAAKHKRLRWMMPLMHLLLRSLCIV